MARMGHKSGSGLGKHGQGRVEPVDVSRQRGRRGLGHIDDEDDKEKMDTKSNSSSKSGRGRGKSSREVRVKGEDAGAFIAHQIQKYVGSYHRESHSTNLDPEPGKESSDERSLTQSMKGVNLDHHQQLVTSSEDRRRGRGRAIRIRNCD